jgi:hypothetical protein
MRRVVIFGSIVLMVAGCGGKKHAAVTQPTVVVTQTTATQPPSTTTKAPTLTSASDRQACAVLLVKIRDVAALVSGSVELMTQSLHPKELARRTGEAQRNVLLAAGSLDLMRVPRPLTTARSRLVIGLQGFAADFGRAKAAVARNDMATAARQLSDPRSLANVAAATKRVNQLCGT